jgi:nucleoside-diphosphate-sugar epimerase
MANYIVTGAAGFIGAKVSELLLKDGHRVVGVDNLNDAYDIRVKEYRLGMLTPHPNFTFSKTELADKDAVFALAEHGPFDGVINLAARAGVRASVENPWVYLSTNTLGTLNLLELSRQHDIPKFVLASTSSIYGNTDIFPTPETADSSRPLQPYSASKKGAEAMAHAFHYLYGLDVTIFRFFTVYGPAGRPDMVMFRFARWITEGVPLRLNGDGEQSRGFTYVDDIARGTILGLKPLGYEIINLGGHEVITINNLIKMLEEKIGRKAEINYHPLHKADALRNDADVTKARKMLGWEAQIGLDEGVSRLVAWYNENRTWASQIDVF